MSHRYDRHCHARERRDLRGVHPTRKDDRVGLDGAAARRFNHLQQGAQRVRNARPAYCGQHQRRFLRCALEARRLLHQGANFVGRQIEQGEKVPHDNQQVEGEGWRVEGE